VSAERDDMEEGIVPVSESPERSMNLRDDCSEELEDMAWRGLLMFWPVITIFCKGI